MTIILGTASDFSTLNAAILAANQQTQAGPYEIDISANVNIEITAALAAINLRAGVTLEIKGNNGTLSGANGAGVSYNQRGLFVYSGKVTIGNLTIAGAVAKGGDSNTGGGGAGLGGGLFVANDVAHGAASAGDVTLVNVSFSGNRALGGSSGVAGLGGGGGGLGGDGKSGGGGVGKGAVGGVATEGAGAAGIVVGAGAAGSGDPASGPGATAFGGANGGGGGGGAWLGFGPIAGIGGGAGGGVGGASVVYNGTGAATVDGVQGGFGGGGAGVGRGIFLQGNQTLTLGAGQTAADTTYVDGEIVDESGSLGGSGVGSVVVNGLGTVALNVSNGFTGGVRLNSGILQLRASNAAGAGSISFGGAATLQLAQGATQTRPLVGFGAGDVVDFLNVPSDPNATVMFETGPFTPPTVKVRRLNGSVAASFQVQGDYNVRNFGLSADSSGFMQVSFRPAPAYRVAANFNGDGFSDLLWRDKNGVLSFWNSAALPAQDVNALRAADLSQARNVAVGVDWTLAGVGHFNGSSADGLLWRNLNGDLTTWNAASGAPMSFTSPANPFHVGLDWQVSKVGDFNGDGYTDILWRHSSGLVDIWSAKPNLPQPDFDFLPVIRLGNDWQVAGVGDFNGSGCDGILWRSINGDVTTWNSTAAAKGSFTGNGGEVYRVGLDWKIAGVGDFNGDGHADILWRHDSGAWAFWIEDPNSAKVAFKDSGSTISPGNQWQLLDIADFNGDGRADLLWRDPATSQVEMWRSYGNVQPLFEHQALTTLSTDWQVASRVD